MDYARAFHRYNLVTSGRWDLNRASDRWSEIAPRMSRYQFDRIVLLGAAVKRIAQIDLPPFWTIGKICTIPHPSGLNHWYNVPLHRRSVEIFLEELYRGATLGVE